MSRVHSELHYNYFGSQHHSCVMLPGVVISGVMFTSHQFETLKQAAWQRDSIHAKLVSLRFSFFAALQDLYENRNCAVQISYNITL